MKKYIYPFALIIIVLNFVSCGNDKKDQSGGNRSQITPVITTKIPTRNITTFSQYNTSIEGIINSEARPKIAGYITDVLVDEGQKVRKGQVLFKLETASLSEEAAAAKANIHAAQVQVDQLKPLVEKEIVSKNQLATAEAKLSQAKASYQSIAANIGYATVKSPVDGYVGEIRIRKGNLVSPNDPTPLTTVADISKVYAYFSMNEKDYLNFLQTAKGETREEKIKNMPPITLIMANGKEYEQKGIIQTINSQIDKQTGSISFRATFDNPAQLLTNGSTGRIQIPKVYENVLVIPQRSTFEQQDQTFVVRVKKTDSSTVAALEKINILDEKDNLYLIDAGVKKGDEIVVEDVAKLREGMAIQPTVKPFDSIAKPLTTVFKDN